MKATVTILAACLALGPAWYAGTATAANGAGPDVGTPATGNPTKDAESWLKQARQAVKDGNFDQADALITKAEKLNVKNDSYLTPWADSPAKLRKFLADEKAKASKPSGKFPVLFGAGKDTKSIPKDPLEGRTPAAPAAREQIIGQLTDELGKAKSTLEAGRQALRNGNVPEAVAAYQKAAAFAGQFGPNDYKPADLANELARAGVDLTRIAAVDRNPAAGVPQIPDNIPNAVGGMADRLAAYAGPTAPPASALGTAGNDPYDIPGGDGAAERLAPRSGGSFPTGNPLPVPAANAGSPNKSEASRLIALSQAALDRNDVQEATRLADQAVQMNIPDQAFGPNETRPWQMKLNVTKAAYRREGVMPAGGTQAVNGNDPYPVARGIYTPENDTTKNVQVRGEGLVSGKMNGGKPDVVIPTLPGRGQPQPAVQQAQMQEPAAPAALPAGAQAFDKGLRALENQDRDGAVRHFQEAWRLKDQLDPLTQKQLSDKLTTLKAGSGPPAKLNPNDPRDPARGAPSPLEAVSSEQELIRQRLVREIANEHQQAQELAQKNPRGALGNLQKLRDRVAAAEMDNTSRVQLLRLVDKYISELDTYINKNLATIENKERNEKIQGDIDRSRDFKLETQNKLATLVEEFNKLMDERRFAEAELKAKQAKEIAPGESVTENMITTVRLVRAYTADETIRKRKDDMVLRSLESTEESAIPFDDRNPLVFGDTKNWTDLTGRRRAQLARDQKRMSPAELEIQRSLSKPVEARFEETPLSEVLDTLGKMTGVNVHLDVDGIRGEGVTSSTPVRLNLTTPVSLRSALNLILEPLHLSYVIQNEVLRITSEQTRNSNVYPRVYYVADLVTPIPNFMPSYNIGLPGALRESLSALGYGGSSRMGGAGPLTVAANDAAQQPSTTTGLNQAVMAQMNQPYQPGGSRAPQHMGSGPGGLGGGVQADFDSLIQLITQTIQPSSWQEVGGPGSIEQFETNLSLVVSQTQEVHEQIADLLEQLRKLQDLQVTIEVRFITLSDSFFERIGVDFDFNIDDNSGKFTGAQNLRPEQTLLGQPPNVLFPDDSGRSVAVGINQAGFTPNLDFQFQQNGFGSATPPFGTIDPNAAATFGFAILSDIEVFLFLNAVSGDDRTNVLQAPKVTLFNGQQAYVSDTSQRPFVTSVVPVVGDFAAAYQPVIVILSEGTSLSVQAVVSADRRFCRLTLVPFFSQIGDVETFTFNGRVTTDTGTTTRDPSKPDANVTNNAQRTVEGTTVQLPTFAFTTVATTVSVPDGGTVLLGGVKRLREGRRERGVPLLSKVPYVSRLFRNVGIGRDAQSLMMMVTPRIIIQEEEEDKLGISDLPK